MKKFAVIGNPIAHSKSPIIHQSFAEQLGHNISYDAVLAPGDGFESTVRGLIEQGYSGCNVTLPFKEQAFQLTDVVSERARLAGAVNTLTFAGEQIAADNTDGQGLVGDITQTLSLKDQHIFMIGAGGAARGCLFPLFQAGVSKITIWNRTAEKAQHLADSFEPYGNIEAVTSDDLHNLAPQIVINSTSSSVSGAIPDIAPKVFSSALLAYDMFYQDEITSFLTFARLHNAAIKTKDGLGMLLGQAAESYRIWNGVLPDINATLKQMQSN